MTYDDTEEYLPFLTPYDAAIILEVSYRRVLQLIRSGQLKATRVQREWIVRKEDLARVKINKKMRPKKPSPGYTREMRESGYIGRRRKHERKEQSK